MARRAQSRRCAYEMELELDPGRDSDLSEEDVSDEGSVLFSVDSEEEPVPVEEGAAVDSPRSTAESDSEQKPARKRRREDESSRRSSDKDPAPSRGRVRGRGRGRHKDRGEASTPGMERWCGVDEPDITPPQPTFLPSRTPGSQHLVLKATYSALQLFQLFFTNSTLELLVHNTNENGRAHCSTSAKPWKDITLRDMFSFLSMVVYMGLVRCPSLTDYWRGGNLYSLPFPQKVITGSKWLRILHALHMSSAEEDAENEERRGTSAFDRLGKVKPLYEEIKGACRRNYHPGQEIFISKRIVSSKARMFRKPRCGFKLFVLADSSNGYMWDFFVYEGKSDGSSGKGLSYDMVMKLMNTSLLGTGYKLFVDSFYTSSTLFNDLLEQKTWACGAIRKNRAGYPKTSVNALDPASPCGSLRWLRTGSLLYVQWRNTREVFLCSTIHTAHGDETIRRMVKDSSGCFTFKDVPVPPAVKDYNRCIGGVGVSDVLMGDYQLFHKTRKWYKMFFYYFVDIAIVNAFVLHKELCKARGEAPLLQKAFRETLAEQLMQVGSQRSTLRPSLPPPEARWAHHRLVYITGDRIGGRLKCRKCHSKTAVKCSSCDKPLCFVPGRDCYNQWHCENNM